MRTRSTSVSVVWSVGVVALGLTVASCGGDDDTPAGGDATADATVDADVGGIAGSAGDDDLLVPRDYLQGEWCDSEGSSWTIEGDTARVVETNGATAELPVDIVFIDDLDTTLVSQTDDQFVFDVGGDEITLTRGAC